MNDWKKEFDDTFIPVYFDAESRRDRYTHMSGKPGEIKAFISRLLEEQKKRHVKILDGLKLDPWNGKGDWDHALAAAIRRITGGNA
jgi:hypothetical protein